MCVCGSLFVLIKWKKREMCHAVCVCVFFCLDLIPVCTIIPGGICVCMNMCSCIFSSVCSSSGRLQQNTKRPLSNELELTRENEALSCATHILNNQLTHITGC